MWLFFLLVFFFFFLRFCDNNTLVVFPTDVARPMRFANVSDRRVRFRCGFHVYKTTVRTSFRSDWDLCVSSEFARVCLRNFNRFTCVLPTLSCLAFLHSRFFSVLLSTVMNTMFTGILFIHKSEILVYKLIRVEHNVYDF